MIKIRFFTFLSFFFLINAFASIFSFNTIEEVSNDIIQDTQSCLPGAYLSINGEVIEFSNEQNLSNSANNIIDNSNDTRWSAFGFPQDITIDLGDNYDVNEITLSTYQNRDYQFVLEGSNTSSLSDFFLLTDESNSSDFGPIIKSFSTQTVRYIKLTVTGANTYNGNWVAINEIEINCAGNEITYVPENCTVGTNLSPNSDILEFSDEENLINSASNLIDGTEETRWSALSYPQYAVIDLGNNLHINEITLRTYLNRDYQFILEGSTTLANSGFSTLVDAMDNEEFGPITKSFPTQVVRFLRLTITGANTYNGIWSAISDLEIICAESIEPDPIEPNIVIPDVIEPDLSDLDTDIIDPNILENNSAFEIITYPNPFIDNINIIPGTSSPEIGVIQLTDVLGRTIFPQNIDIGKEEISLSNLESLSSGLYLVQILSKNGILISTEKIIKK